MLKITNTILANRIIEIIESGDVENLVSFNDCLIAVKDLKRFIFSVMNNQFKEISYDYNNEEVAKIIYEYTNK